MIQICIRQVFLYRFVYNFAMQVAFKNNKIAEFRESQHMSQRRLAKEIGTSQANLSRWEKGIIEPSIIMCWCLADYFDVSIDVLCGRTEY